MCQCLICGCWWYNYCGVCCGGCHEAHLIYSWWLCKPEDLRMIDPECCKICACDGLGYNCLYYGSICCATKAIQEWSGLRSAGKTAADLNSGKTIIINNTSPVYMQGGYEMDTTTVRTQGVNMGVNMGAPNMNVNANMGMGGNVNMNTNMGMGGANINMNTNMGGANMQMNNNMGGNYNGGMGGNVSMGVNGGMGGNANMGVGGGMGGANVNMGVGMGGANVNMGVGVNTPSANAKISF